MRAVIITLLLLVLQGNCEPSLSPDYDPPGSPRPGALANQVAGGLLEDTIPTSGADAVPNNGPATTISVQSGTIQPAAVVAGAATATGDAPRGLQPSSTSTRGGDAVTPGECGTESIAEVLLVEYDICRADEMVVVATPQSSRIGVTSPSSDASGAPSDAATQQVGPFNGTLIHLHSL